ncbi:sensor histidine kinase [Streptomyces prasinopilosus]|uniref:histidine kinase n=1 Tax=Streptomyces prasinopilosus TaxID=67344 RepID=A0A1G6P6S6_9ACTN|nr:histidine kinase [Streptomyces prasinopilosus]SDC75779.1 Signal transduction histidine kinase [Streptomyces prasinopilosus]
MSLPRLRPLAVDSAVALGFAAVGCIAGAYYQPPGWRAFDGPGYVLACLTALPLVARRRFPLPAVLASAAGYAVYLGCGYQPSVNFWAPAVALLSLAGRRPLGVALAGAVPVVAVIVLSGVSGRLHPALTAAQALLVPVVAIAFGHTRHLLVRANARLRDVTAELVAEQEERARDAVTLERMAIARELHDVVAHHMSVITIQAGLAETVLTSDVPMARKALGHIALTGREALDELRRLLTVLRVRSDDDGQGTPYGAAPRLDRLPDLISGATAAGLDVRFTARGEPGPLPPVVDVCAYRVVQEALTNVIKHAPGARVALTVDHTPDEVVLVVRNDAVRDGGGPDGSDGRAGRGGRAAHGGRAGRTRTDGRPETVPGTGLGLIGMRERVKICGGRLSAAPHDGGGFEVVAVLPLRASRHASPGEPEGQER